jgi:uncharacterized protein YjdB
MLAVAAAMLGCLDAAGPRGVRRVALALVPVFDQMAPQDGTPTDVDSFVVRISNPPAPDLVRSVLLPPGQDEIRLEVEVEIVGAIDTVSVSFEGYNAATGLLLYQSPATPFAITAGLPVPRTPVNAQYVGPGREIRSLTVAPRAAALSPGGTVQLTYTGYDTAGVEMPDDIVFVRYRSSNVAAATVSSAGLVSGVAAGQARVLVISLADSNIRDTATVDVVAAPPPLIGLSTVGLTFRDTAGTGDPAPQTVGVTNAGGGSLDGLAVGTVTYGPGATGWATASLSGTSAPATLTIAVTNAGLNPGTYTAVVPVTASGVANSPQSVTVTYALAVPPVSAITLTPGFAVLRAGDTTRLAVSGVDGLGNPVPSVTGATFTSRNTAVATVAANGLITGVAPGSVVIVGTITPTIQDSMLVIVAGTGSAVAYALAADREFATARVNDTVRVRVSVDLRAVAPEKLGSYNDSLLWDPAVLRYVRSGPVAGGFAAPTINELSAPSGLLRFGSADPNGAAGPTVALIDVVFVAQASGAGALSLRVSDLSAALQPFTNLLPAAVIHAGVVRVQ